MPDKGEVVKIRLSYEKETQTLSQCDPAATSKDLFEVAEAIASLKTGEVVEYVKITEARLIG